MSKVSKAVIPVAGFGTRFLPVTKSQPKEMLPIVDKPVLQYIVEDLVASGITQIVFITNQTKNSIEDHFDRNFELEYRLKEAGKKEQLEEIKAIARQAKFFYTRQWAPLGNGHALLCAKEFLQNEPFIFSDGDNIIDSKVPVTKQLIDIYEKYGAGVMGVLPVDKKEAVKYGMVQKGKMIDARTCVLKGLVEKPEIAKTPSNWASLGMKYLFTPDIFEYLEKTKPGKGGEIWLADAVNAYVKENRFLAHVYEGIYYDCGSKLGYLKANIDYAMKRPELAKELRAYLKKLF